MWPWGHAAVGYLLWSALVRRIDDRAPTGEEVWLLALGTQFPDLVDKPLAWGLGVLPSGRSLAHSLLVAAVVIAAVYGVMRRRRRESSALAFGLGYVSHSLADTVSSLSTGEYDKLTYLLWPVLPAPVYESAPLAPGGQALFSGLDVVQLGLVVVALGLWRRDGLPGLAGRLRAAVG